MTDLSINFLPKYYPTSNGYLSLPSMENVALSDKSLLIEAANNSPWIADWTAAQYAAKVNSAEWKQAVADWNSGVLIQNISLRRLLNAMNNYNKQGGMAPGVARPEYGAGIVNQWEVDGAPNRFSALIDKVAPAAFVAAVAFISYGAYTTLSGPALESGVPGASSFVGPAAPAASTDISAALQSGVPGASSFVGPAAPTALIPDITSLPGLVDITKAATAATALAGTVQKLTAAPVAPVAPVANNSTSSILSGNMLPIVLGVGVLFFIFVLMD